MIHHSGVWYSSQFWTLKAFLVNYLIRKAPECNLKLEFFRNGWKVSLDQLEGNTGSDFPGRELNQRRDTA